MKKMMIAVSMLAVLAACNRGAENNMSAAGNSTANSSAGLPTPAERPTQTAGQTAMPPGLDCVRNRLTPEQRRAAADVAMEQGTRDDPRVQALLQATDACGEELSWSPQKRRLAGMFSMSAAGAAGIRETLGARGISFDELDQAILGDQELMQAAAAGQLSGAVGQQFASRHAALIERMVGSNSDVETGTRIGNYIAFRALAETTARQFGSES